MHFTTAVAFTGAILTAKFTNADKHFSHHHHHHSSSSSSSSQPIARVLELPYHAHHHTALSVAVPHSLSTSIAQPFCNRRDNPYHQNVIAKHPYQILAGVVGNLF
ncbi:hypothetical protein BDR26DRAFT_940177 [Obelidium mucronatum]|nr:hypothetical protein BDR26DRAFT_940177 [Obelidium mucronatum]